MKDKKQKIVRTADLFPKEAKEGGESKVITTLDLPDVPLRGEEKVKAITTNEMPFLDPHPGEKDAADAEEDGNEEN